jgi:hypothetical protein
MSRARRVQHLVQILLPLRNNQGEPFPKKAFDQVRDELTESFGGVTFYRRSPAEGLWKPGAGDVNRDDVVIFEVMTETLDRRWWRGYRDELAGRFCQDDLVVRAIGAERL